ILPGICAPDFFCIVFLSIPGHDSFPFCQFKLEYNDFMFLRFDFQEVFSVQRRFAPQPGEALGLTLTKSIHRIPFKNL
ncbi:MAG: hypothetical protein ACYTCV_10380, partial [Planctomycetota bacterium]